jgi:hypothetical protein
MHLDECDYEDAFGMDLFHFVRHLHNIAVVITRVYFSSVSHKIGAFQSNMTLIETAHQANPKPGIQ